MRAFQNAALMQLRQVGKTILQNIDRVDRFKISRDESGKKSNSLVTSIDESLVDRLKTLYPDHNILSRVSGMHKSDRIDHENQYTWIIDPIDGIDNLMAGIPVCAISIALFHNKECIPGLVYQPINDEVFTASGQRIFYEGKS